MSATDVRPADLVIENHGIPPPQPTLRVNLDVGRVLVIRILTDGGIEFCLSGPLGTSSIEYHSPP